MILNLVNELWAGDEASHEAALAAERAMLELGVDQLRASKDKDEDPNLLLQVSGNVAIISIRGPLVNANVPNWVAEMFGVTTYKSIREAATTAAHDQNVSSILLDIQSGGGAVSGVMETSDHLSLINSSVKPVYTHGESLIASAAVWLGVNGRTMSITKGTLAGSIGVIYTHVEYSKRLEESGAKARVFRAGKHKALGQPVEPLTAAAEEQIQARLDHTYTLFVEHVAAKRGKSYADTHKNMADGQEFYGDGAVKAGLADKVCSFEERLLEVQRLHSTHTVRSNPMGSRALLNHDALAAAALAGIDTEKPEKPEDSTKPATQPTGADPSQGDGAAAAGAGKPEEPAKAPEDEGTKAVLAYVQNELAETRKDLVTTKAELTAAKIEQASAEAALEAVVAVSDQMAEVVRDSVQRMRVALGLPTADLSSLEGVHLLAAHKSMKDEFLSKFKAGGVAAVAPTDQKQAGPAADDPKFQAALAATRTHQTK